MELAEQNFGKRLYTGDNIVGTLGEIEAQVRQAELEVGLTRDKKQALLNHKARLAVRAPFDGTLLELPRAQRQPHPQGRHDRRHRAAQPPPYPGLPDAGGGQQASVLATRRRCSFPALQETHTARVFRIDRTSGFVREQDQRYNPGYSWRGPTDRSAKVFLALEDRRVLADRETYRSGLPAVVVFPQRSTNPLARHDQAQVVDGVLVVEEAAMRPMSPGELPDRSFGAADVRGEMVDRRPAPDPALFQLLLHRAVPAAQSDLEPGGARVRLRHRHPRRLALHVVDDAPDPRGDLQPDHVPRSSRARADAVWASGWRPKRVHFQMTTFREARSTAEAVVRSICSEVREAGIPATIWIGSSEAEDERTLIRHFKLVGDEMGIDLELRIIRQNQPGKRVAIALILRAMSRAGLGHDDLVVFMDGDFVLDKGCLTLCLPLFATDPDLHALTTDEDVIVKGPQWMQSWLSMRFSQRRMAMQSHALSRRVLTLTGRFSMFRATHITSARVHPPAGGRLPRSIGCGARSASCRATTRAPGTRC